jgi:hypothetical protein
MSSELITIYRFSDSGQTSPDGKIQNKARPQYFNKRNILLNFIKIFTNDNLYIVADNINHESYEFLLSIVKSPEHIIPTDYKSGALSFLHSVRFIIDQSKQSSWNDETGIYFVEDDYIHRDGCDKIIKEGLKIADYVTAYDHPDKYLSKNMGGNPLLQTVDNRATGENTLVFLTRSSHWKITNSTTMTFATKLKIIKDDYSIYNEFCNTGYPHDFEMFLELSKRKCRVLISSIPAYSTHCENCVLSPLYDWNNILI